VGPKFHGRKHPESLILHTQACLIKVTSAEFGTLIGILSK